MPCAFLSAVFLSFSWLDSTDDRIGNCGLHLGIVVRESRRHRESLCHSQSKEGGPAGSHTLLSELAFFVEVFSG